MPFTVLKFNKRQGHLLEEIRSFLKFEVMKYLIWNIHYVWNVNSLIFRKLPILLRTFPNPSIHSKFKYTSMFFTIHNKILELLNVAPAELLSFSQFREKKMEIYFSNIKLFGINLHLPLLWLFQICNNIFININQCIFFLLLG